MLIAVQRHCVLIVMSMSTCIVFREVFLTVCLFAHIVLTKHLITQYSTEGIYLVTLLLTYRTPSYIGSHWDEATRGLAAADVTHRLLDALSMCSLCFVSQGEVRGGRGRDDGSGRRKQLLADERRRLPDGRHPRRTRLLAHLGRQAHHAGAVLRVASEW